MKATVTLKVENRRMDSLEKSSTFSNVTNGQDNCYLKDTPVGYAV